MDSDGFGMPDALEQARWMGPKLVGFVKRIDSLTTRFNRAYNRQRALCEDLVLIRSYFKLIEQTKAKYSILYKDVYSFNKAGFIIGKIIA